MTDGVVDIDNASTTGTFEVGFDLKYKWKVEAIGDNLSPLEFSFAGVIIDLFVDDPAGTVTPDPPFPILSESEFDPFFGFPGGTLTSEGFSDKVVDPFDPDDFVTFAFSVTVGPEDYAEIFVLNDTFGDANAVPEPATMLLLGSGLLGFSGVRKRFRKG